MINGYVMVTSHNFNKLSEKHIINLGYRLKYGTIWCRCLTNNYNKDYALQFEADSLVDFAQKHPDMDVTCLHIKLSLFDFEGHKIEREVRQELFELQQQVKQKEVESSTECKLNSLMTDFSEPLFTKLATEAKSIEMLARQVTTLKEQCPFDHQKYTVAYDVIDDYNVRKQELTELLKIFSEKQQERELEFLNNKADQALEQI
jgi:hypothetical protein